MTSSTNAMGKTPSEAAATAIAEVFAPEIRKALQGKPIADEQTLRDRVERELSNRGFTITR